MTTLLACGVALLGVVLGHWAHAGIEDGDRNRRAWARTASPIVVAVAALAWVLSQALQSAP